MINYSGPNSNHVLTAGQKHQNLPSNQQTDFQAVHTEHLAICTLLLCGRGRVIRKNGPPVHPRPSHETPHSRQLRFFTSETPKTLILCPAPASSSDTFRKGVTSGTPPPSVRNGRGFRPWKAVLRSTTPSTGEATPRGVTVVKAFAQENPSTMPSEGPGTKASYLRRRRPDAQTPQLPPGPLLPTCCCHTPPPGSQIRRSASPYPQGGHSTPHLLRSSLPHHHGELARRRSTTSIGLRDGKSGHRTSRSDCRPKANLLRPPTAPTWATGSGQLHAPRTEAASTLAWPTAHGACAPPDLVPSAAAKPSRGRGGRGPAAMAPLPPSSHLHGLPAVCSGDGEAGGRRKRRVLWWWRSRRPCHPRSCSILPLSTSGCD